MWVDRALDLHTTARIPMDAAAAARVVLIAQSAAPSKSSLDAYLTMAREEGDSASVAVLDPLAAQLGD